MLRCSVLSILYPDNADDEQARSRYLLEGTFVILGTKTTDSNNAVYVSYRTTWLEGYLCKILIRIVPVVSAKIRPV